jgi:nucleoid-associated protein YgaU
MFGSGVDIEQAFGHRRGMHRTRVRRRRLVAVLLTAGIAGLVSGPVAKAVVAGGGGGSSSRTHVVRRGETLWSIATRLEPSQDPRVVVDAIASANRLDPGSLVPGQELQIPTAG